MLRRKSEECIFQSGSSSLAPKPDVPGRRSRACDCRRQWCLFKPRRITRSGEGLSGCYSGCLLASSCHGSLRTFAAALVRCCSVLFFSRVAVVRAQHARMVAVFMRAVTGRVELRACNTAFKKSACVLSVWTVEPLHTVESLHTDTVCQSRPCSQPSLTFADSCVICS
jgi:hypothetical protein